MAEPEPLAMPVANSAESTEVVAAETKASPPRYLSGEETPPLPLAITFQKHLFRSPPFLQWTPRVFA
jgi:hypothetical protein